MFLQVIRLFILSIFTFTTLLCQNASFETLGNFNGNQFESKAYCVSTDGAITAVTISTDNGKQAFIWDNIDGAKSLGNVPDNSLMHSWTSDISADGSVIVGNGNVTDQRYFEEGLRGFIWSEENGMVLIGDKDSICQANAISADGSVVVGRYGNYAYRWTMDDGFEILGTIDGCNFSSASDISDDGMIITGTCSKELYQDEVTFIWTREEGMISLGYLPGGVTSFPNAISPDGSVIVGSADGNTTGTLFKWTEESGMQVIPHLPGRTLTHPMSVSNYGNIIVGASLQQLTGTAFIWDNENGIRDLQEVLESDYDLDLSGYTLTLANSISRDENVIVGEAVNSVGNAEAFKVTLDTSLTNIKYKNESVLKEFELYQNYPNPFNPSTVIKYKLAKSSFIELSIYNILGQKIKTLVNIYQDSGSYSVVWNSSDNNNLAASGIYFYQLKVDNQVLQRKMILAK